MRVGLWKCATAILLMRCFDTAAFCCFINVRREFGYSGESGGALIESRNGGTQRTLGSVPHKGGFPHVPKAIGAAQRMFNSAPLSRTASLHAQMVYLYLALLP